MLTYLHRPTSHPSVWSTASSRCAPVSVCQLADVLDKVGSVPPSPRPTSPASAATGNAAATVLSRICSRACGGTPAGCAAQTWNPHLAWTTPHRDRSRRHRTRMEPAEGRTASLRVRAGWAGRIPDGEHHPSDDGGSNDLGAVGSDHRALAQPQKAPAGSSSTTAAGRCTGPIATGRAWRPPLDDRNAKPRDDRRFRQAVRETRLKSAHRSSKASGHFRPRPLRMPREAAVERQGPLSASSIIFRAHRDASVGRICPAYW
jgi:hypothetical protein